MFHPTKGRFQTEKLTKCLVKCNRDGDLATGWTVLSSNQGRNKIVQKGIGAHTAVYSPPPKKTQKPLNPRKKVCGVRLIIHLHLVLSLRMRGALPLLPPYVTIM